MPFFIDIINKVVNNIKICSSRVSFKELSTACLGTEDVQDNCMGFYI